MSDVTTRARMMARIATPLLSASVRSHPSNADPESLAQYFAADINRVVPITQALIAALAPKTEEEHEEVNAIVAPVTAQMVAQNAGLLAGEGEEIARFLKPSLNVLVSFCDRESHVEPLSDLDNPLGQSVLALSPIVGCLSRYAFGKSPAKRLTDTLDVLTRAQGELVGGLPRTMAADPALRCALMAASAHLFASHFDVMLNAFAGTEMDDPEARFKELLSQWGQSIGLLGILVRHAAADGDTAASTETNVRPLRARKSKDKQEDEDEGETSSSGGGSSGGVKPGYNPMSFFSKKGV